MNLSDARQAIARTLSSQVVARVRRSKQTRDLKAIQRIACTTDNLRRGSDLFIDDLFESNEIDEMWRDSRRNIDAFSIPDGTGGVNPGDRRAIYYLISGLMPSSVLEVGTHIGASTLHIASALHLNRVRNGVTPHLTTVDIRDVNSPTEKPWRAFGTSRSPGEMIEALGYGSFVEFVVDTSIGYAARCDRKFDFIFLDGDHSAPTVYQEVPVALNLLNRGGAILLHDYFPDLKPLWSDGSVIPGPFLAIQRLLREGANLTVVPLGTLPWPTKLQSNVTNLALLLRNE